MGKQLNSGNIAKIFSKLSNYSVKDSKIILRYMLESFSTIISSGYDMKLNNIGTFKLFTRKGRESRHNVYSRKMTPLNPKRAVKFVISKNLKDKVEMLPYDGEYKENCT